MKFKVVTAEDIILGAKQQRRPRVRFPGLSAQLNAQVDRMISQGTHVRRGASPFVRDVLSRTHGRKS